MRAAGIVGEQARQLLGLARRPVPDEIVAPVSRPQIIVGPGHRIAEHLLVVGQAEREVLEQVAMQRGRERGFVHQPAPRGVARIERDHIGEELLANGRADAVRANEDIPLLLRAVGKMRNDAIALLDAAQFLAAVIVGFRERGFQQVKHAIPCGHGLRDFHAVGHAAVAREHHPPRHLDAQVAVGIEPERAHHGLQFRLRHDAGAAPGERFGDALVDTTTSNPRRLSASAASRPLIDPPITSARTSPPDFSRSGETCYSLAIFDGGMPWR